jgi:hypothetical protein
MIDFQDSFAPELHLLGLISNLPIWQTAFYLNQDARFKFSRSKHNLKASVRRNLEAEYSCYIHKDSQQNLYLLSNSSLPVEQNEIDPANSLFSIEPIFPLFSKYKQFQSWIIWEQGGTTTEFLSRKIKSKLPHFQVFEVLVAESKMAKVLGDVIDFD